MAATNITNTTATTKMRRGPQVYTLCFDVMFKVIRHKCTFTVTSLIQRNDATPESTSNSMHNHAVHDAVRAVERVTLLRFLFGMHPY